MAQSEQNDKSIAEIQRMLPDDETIYELANLFRFSETRRVLKFSGVCRYVRCMCAKSPKRWK